VALKSTMIASVPFYVENAVSQTRMMLSLFEKISPLLTQYESQFLAAEILNLFNVFHYHKAPMTKIRAAISAPIASILLGLFPSIDPFCRLGVPVALAPPPGVVANSPAGTIVYEVTVLRLPLGSVVVKTTCCVEELFVVVFGALDAAPDELPGVVETGPEVVLAAAAVTVVDVEPTATVVVLLVVGGSGIEVWIVNKGLVSLDLGGRRETIEVGREEPGGGTTMTGEEEGPEGGVELT
jgi:hypothetical protein